MKSLSEIETTANRASRAAGYSWGIAEEVGKSIRLSELFGFSAIKHLNQYYQNKKKENFEEIKVINNINKYLSMKAARGGLRVLGFWGFWGFCRVWAVFGLHR